ncbi:MAG TPA: peroxiredoxin [Polyangiaceae bacterium]|jgi:peroxiredoxin Q/BCP|nr:peroxiredoxin [Polyangiaceae bacterium]
MRFPTAFLGMCLACNSSGSRGIGAEPIGALPGPKPPGDGERGHPESTERVPSPEPGLSQPAPDVDLALHNGKHVRLGELRGQNVVLFFYPMDDTPGCRVEAQGFRDRFSQFRAKNTTVFGVSLQGAESHQAFIDKEHLPFDLVVDGDARVAEAFGVPVHGQVTARQTVLVDAQGQLAHVWRNVSPDQHAAEVLAMIPPTGH